MWYVYVDFGRDMVMCVDVFYDFIIYLSLIKVCVWIVVSGWFCVWCMFGVFVFFYYKIDVVVIFYK